jgi:hypothetical protein
MKAYSLTATVEDMDSKTSLIPNENRRLLRGSPWRTPFSDDKCTPLLLRNSRGDGELYEKCTIRKMLLRGSVLYS